MPKYFLLGIMFLYVICTAAASSLPFPFYPMEARARGALPSEVKTFIQLLLPTNCNTLYTFKYGFSFGITNLAALIASPFCVTYSETWGAKKLYIIGVTGLVVSTICFGFLDFTCNKLVFLGASYILR